MKPQLPPEIAALFPTDVIRHIYRFVPHIYKEKLTPKMNVTMSPKALTDLRMIQLSPLRGKSERYMIDLDDFILD
jgi:hypothetical protein